jgi:UDPglucose--hexose-1-phosphate uridylyltransferase
VAIAPARATRPGASEPVADELESCPFCAGREDRTPPETLRIGDPWRVRVVPNLYPALERQEVVVHSPEHLRSVAELADEQLELVAEAWQRRAADVPGHVYAFVNEGREAGSSLPHTHSQLAWLSVPPPLPAAETGLSLDGPVVLERDGLVVQCPTASRVPYEVLIAPADPEPGAFRSARLGAALALLGEAVRRIRAVVGAVPLNAWLHDTSHWHLEVLPRRSVLAGLELGAGVYLNAVPPEDAAAALRGVSSRA